jgi:hypothetical protein
MYKLEKIRSFPNFFRVEGFFFGFHLKSQFKSVCYYDFGLKFKLKGIFKKFVKFNKLFKNTLFIKSLFLKKETLSNNFCIIQKKQKNDKSFFFRDAFINNYEKLKKFHLYKLYNRIIFMNFEKQNIIPLQFSVSTDK